MGWKCILGDWFNQDCNWKIGSLLLLALFLSVIYVFCMNNRTPQKYSQRLPPSAPPYQQPTGTPIYHISLDDRDGPVMGRYSSTKSYSTSNHTIHNIKTNDPNHIAKNIEVHYHSDNDDTSNWPNPAINNQGDLQIKDTNNIMRGHISVHSDGQKIAHQQVIPE